MLEKKQLTQEDLKKRQEFQSHLHKQSELRQQQHRHKKAQQEANKKEAQDMLVIYAKFKSATDHIVSQLKGEEVDFKSVLLELQDLKDYFASVLYVLTGYDKQHYKDSLDRIQSHIYQVRKAKEPRKKFTFTLRNQDFTIKGKTASKIEVKAVKDQPDLTIFRGIKSLKDQEIVIEKGQLIQAYQIQDCQNCTITLKGHMHALHIKRLKNCRVVSGPSKSAVHIDSCEACHLTLMAHQARIHNCKNVQFCLFVASKAIIEGSEGLRFRELKVGEGLYEGMKDDWDESGLKDRSNQWRQVQDFNWLKEEKSPNFQLLE